VASRLAIAKQAPANALGLDLMQQQTQQLEDWRRSAQKVTRAWHAWLDADRSDHGVCYRAYVSALAAEERAAAEVERAIQPDEPNECVTRSVTGRAGPEAS
jgi:hypothetical protein